MSEYKLVNSTQLDIDLTNICNTIRNLPQGGQSNAGSSSFPTGIQTAIVNACENSYQNGYNEGINAGGSSSEGSYDEGLNYAAQQAQQFGAKTSYQYWKYAEDITNLKIPYEMAPINCQYMFTNSVTQDGSSIDLSQFNIDFSKCTDFGYWLNGAAIGKIGTLNTTSATSLATLLYNTQTLVTIECLVLKSDGSQTLGANFGKNAKALVNINQIEGKFGKTFGFANATKLSHDTLINILNALYDYSGTSTAPSLAIGTTNLNKLSDAEKQIAANKGWNLTA